MGGSRPPSPVRGHAIPLALRDRPQWVVWRWEQRDDGKWTKPPYSARSGSLARSTGRETWASFDEARRVLPSYDGLGYVLSDDDPFVGIDLDGCRHPETGDIDPWAREIVERINTYTEVSPSGTGLRLILTGSLPPGGRKHDDIEVYSTGRYLTMTGAHVDGTPREIEARQAELEAFHRRHFPPPAPPRDTPPEHAARISLGDAALIAKASGARNGAQFRRLWGGDTGGDHSKADLMLCGLLAFWTAKDPGQMDRLFRQSGLMRAKWDERHFSDGRTYGQATIDRALTDAREVYRAQAPPRAERSEPAPEPPEPIALSPLSWDELMAKAPAPITYQWPSWVVDKKIILVAGAGESYKSWLCGFVALMTAAGRPALGTDPCLQGPALLVSAENGEDEDLRRLHLLRRGHDLPLTGLPFTLLPADTLSLRDPATWASFTQLVATLAPRVIVIDSAISVADLENENDNAEVHKFMKTCILPLARVYGATVYLIVHSPKLPTQKGLVFTDEHVARGASDWRNASDGMLYLKRDKTLGETAVVLRPAKVRIGLRPAPIWFTVEDTETDPAGQPIATRLILGGTFSDATGQGEAAALGKAVSVAIEALKGSPGGALLSELSDTITGGGVPKMTARRALDVLRGRYPWPSGLHAGQRQSIVLEQKQGRSKALVFDPALPTPAPADDDISDID